MASKNRVLRFAVKNQHIMKDKECDFSGLVSGTEGILEAQFGFTSEWNGMNKIAVFEMLGITKIAKLDRMGKCEIPSEVLKYKAFEVSVVGEIKGSDKRRLKTDTVKVIQKVV